MRRLIGVLALVWAFGVGGCAHVDTPIFDTFQEILTASGTEAREKTIAAVMQPRYRYMRVQVEGHPPGLLILAFQEPNAQGPVGVWYSGEDEVLRIQNGRIVGTAGLLQDWLSVRSMPGIPGWLDVPRKGLTYTRVHDAMPGYHYGIVEEVELTPWDGVPPIKLPNTLPLAKAQEYRWFRERSRLVPNGSEATGRDKVQGGQGGPGVDAWFAWGRHRGVETIVYSEQCLGPDFCLKLQRWPLAEEAQ